MPGKYIKLAIVAAGALMMLLGVYQLAGWWGLPPGVDVDYFPPNTPPAHIIGS
jgi:hypothetical protein